MKSQLNRRDACRTLMAGVGLIPSLAFAQTPKEKFQLRYSLASCMYGTMPLAEILSEVRKTGSEGIDLWPRPHGNQRNQVDEMGEDRFEALLSENDVRLNMTTRYDLGAFKLSDEVRFVKRFGGRLIVTGAYPVGGTTLKEQVREFVRKIEPHVEIAAENGVTIAIENHAKSLIESSDSLRYLAEFAKSPHLGIALAPYHLPQNPADLAALIRELGPKLVHFYAWEHGDGCFEKLPKEQELKQLPGRGPLDFAPLLQALEAIHFQGWTQIFMHPVPRGIPILETRDEVTRVINETRDYLSRTLASVSR